MGKKYRWMLTLEHFCFNLNAKPKQMVQAEMCGVHISVDAFYKTNRKRSMNNENTSYQTKFARFKLHRIIEMRIRPEKKNNGMAIHFK